MPVEAIADRGPDTLRFGPMKPVGLPDPRTGREPWAVVQLRRDNALGTLYNLVGFQTGLKWSEQRRVFSMIPGLERAEFVRFGVMHRNTSVNAPAVLDAHLRPLPLGRGDLFLAGQITGVEGYMESTAMGLVAGVNAARLLEGLPLPEWPGETAVGSLLRYLRGADPRHFQPMNTNLGIFPPPYGADSKQARARRRFLRPGRRRGGGVLGGTGAGITGDNGPKGIGGQDLLDASHPCGAGYGGIPGSRCAPGRANLRRI